MGILDDILQQIDAEQEPQPDSGKQDPADTTSVQDQKPDKQEAKDSDWYGRDFKQFAGIK